MPKYVDKRVWNDVDDKWSLKNFVNEEFNRIEKKNWVWYRDDQEIRNAWLNICNKLIKEIKNDKSMVYGKWALEPLTKLINDLKVEYSRMTWMKLFTNNADKINQIANRIDNAENETLKRLAKNRTTQDSRDIVSKWNELYKEKPMFLMEWWNDVKKQTWNIVFTEVSNPVKIHDALKWLFSNPNIVYEIDYSWCKNDKIKEKMTWLIWAQTCYLRYDKEQNTYTIRDKDWNWISDRAYIWEWVKLIPSWVRSWQSYNEERISNEKLWNIDNSQIESLTKLLLKEVPSARKLSVEQQKELVVKTDNRITSLLRRAKRLWYELQAECVTKKWFWNWHMELHLNWGASKASWSTEVNRTIWWNDWDYNKELWKELDDFIDGNEWDYCSYLTNRVRVKWNELDKLTKVETTNLNKENVTESEKNNADAIKQQMLYWISLFEQMIENFIESEGDSWLDNDDKNLVQIKKLIRNAKASIDKSNVIDSALFIKNFLDPIWEKWASIKNLNSNHKSQYNKLKTVFFWKRDEQISALRSLWWKWRIFDKTETSFLAEEIASDENLKVKDVNVQKCLDNIKNWTSMSVFNEDGTINEKVKWRYDSTYDAAKNWTDALISLFVSRWWLPENRKKEWDVVRESMDNLRNQLTTLNTQIDNITPSIDSMVKETHDKRLLMEQKPNKTENDMKVLQSLIWLEENENEARKHYKNIVDKTNMEIKYQWLWDSVRRWLIFSLWELWGWFTWTNSDIANDIKWYWLFDFSDENSKLAWEIMKDIAITVAVARATWWMWAWLIAQWLNIWARAARWANWIQVADNISKSVTLINTYKKAWTIWNAIKVIRNTSTAAKLTLWTALTSWLLIEGVAFNAASNVIHSAMNWTSLDSLDLNPVAKENIQTAAFLWALSIAWKLTWSMVKAFWKSKLKIDFKKWLQKAHLESPAVFTAWLVTEIWTMLTAEQMINLTFWHDVVDPNTWEVVTERFHLPTQQELIQMVWMILAFRVVKPQLWHKYEQRLNQWTLEICRWINGNQILIREPKTWKIEDIQDLIDWKRSLPLRTEISEWTHNRHNDNEWLKKIIQKRVVII